MVCPVPDRHGDETDRPLRNLTDIKILTVNEPSLLSELGPAFEKYNEEQFATVKLPGSSQPVIISSHNSLGNGRYFDVESSSSFAFDHATQVRPILSWALFIDPNKPVES